MLRDRKTSPMKSPTTSALATTKQTPTTSTPERKTRSHAMKSPPPASAAGIPQSPSDLLSPELGKPPATKATPRKTSIAAALSHPQDIEEEEKGQEKIEVQEEVCVTTYQTSRAVELLSVFFRATRTMWLCWSINRRPKSCLDQE